MKAIKINSKRAAFYDTAGEGYIMIEDYRNAVKIMSLGIQIAPEAIHLNFQLDLSISETLHEVLFKGP